MDDSYWNTRSYSNPRWSNSLWTANSGLFNCRSDRNCEKCWGQRVQSQLMLGRFLRSSFLGFHTFKVFSKIFSENFHSSCNNFSFLLRDGSSVARTVISIISKQSTQQTNKRQFLDHETTLTFFSIKRRAKKKIFMTVNANCNSLVSGLVGFDCKTRHLQRWKFVLHRALCPGRTRSFVVWRWHPEGTASETTKSSSRWSTKLPGQRRERWGELPVISPAVVSLPT